MKPILKELRMPSTSNENIEYAKKYAPQKENKIILFPSSPDKKKENEKYPDFKGYMTDNDGNVSEVAGWKNKSKKGTPYLSCNLTPLNFNIKEKDDDSPKETDIDIPF